MEKGCIYCNNIFDSEKYGDLGIRLNKEIPVCPACIMQTPAGKLYGSQVILHTLALLDLLYNFFDFTDAEADLHELERIMGSLGAMHARWLQKERRKSVE